MKRAFTIIAALALVVGLAGCDYGLGAKTPGVRYSINHNGCVFTYVIYQDGFYAAANVADFWSNPGVYTCEISVQAVSHDGQGHVTSGPWSGPVQYGGRVGPIQCDPCALTAKTGGYVFGLRIHLRAWQPAHPERIMFDDYLGGSVLGYAALAS